MKLIFALTLLVATSATAIAPQSHRMNIQFPNLPLIARQPPVCGPPPFPQCPPGRKVV